MICVFAVKCAAALVYMWIWVVYCTKFVIWWRVTIKVPQSWWRGVGIINCKPVYSLSLFFLFLFYSKVFERHTNTHHTFFLSLSPPLPFFTSKSTTTMFKLSLVTFLSFVLFQLTQAVSVTITSPKPNDVLKAGETVEIKWFVLKCIIIVAASFFLTILSRVQDNCR